MASRDSMDDASQPLMSAVEAEPATGPKRLHPGLVARPLSPPARRYGDEWDDEKRWPISILVLFSLRVLIMIFALVDTILTTRGRSVPVEIALTITSIIQLIWNFFKSTPQSFWKALLCSRGRDGKRKASCTLGAYKVVLLESNEDEDKQQDQVQPAMSSRLLKLLLKSLPEMAIIFVLMVCTIVYTVDYVRLSSGRVGSRIVAFTITNIVLQAFCLVLPHMNTCGPFSVTMNYSASSRKDYQYHLRLPQEETSTHRGGNQPVSVKAV